MKLPFFLFHIYEEFWVLIFVWFQKWDTENLFRIFQFVRFTVYIIVIGLGKLGHYFQVVRMSIC